MASPPTSMRGILTPTAEPWRLERRAPADDLSDLVDFHWIVTWDLPPGAVHVQGVLSFPSANLAAAPDGAFLHGPVSVRYDRRLEGRGRGIGTRLRAGVVAGLTRRPAHTLADRVLALDEVFGDDGGGLAATLTGPVGVDEHITAVEAFLRARRPAPDLGAQLAARVVDHMLANPLETRVGDVAAAFGVSPRALQRVFREHVGLTPKAVLQRSRLHEAVERVEAGADAEGGASLALDLGYSDQAHFINDFRDAVGRSPSRYRPRRA